ncbi:MAG: hypothetical protein WBL93_07695 [Lutisporaceae bacterium]
MPAKIQYANYIREDEHELVYYEDLNEDIYEEKYKGYLFCNTEGCNAQLRFTERNDGVTFFSTWNNQLDLHDENCRFRIVKSGEVDAATTYGSYVTVTITDDRILESLKRKSKDLQTERKPGKPRNNRTTPQSKEVGTKEVPKFIDIPNAETQVDKAQGLRINSIDANFAGSFINQRRIIFGLVKSAEFKNEGHALINLNVNAKDTRLYIPPAFYSENTSRADLNNFINVINKEINNGPIVILCAGFIRETDDFLNIDVINPNLIETNGKTYFEVIYTNKIPTKPYINV